MPIPKPEAGESQDDFINRCMGDQVMVDDFPDESQRYAVCIDQVKAEEVKRAINQFIKENES